MERIDEIYRDALLFSQASGDDEQAALKRLCQAAADGLKARLRPGVAPEDCGGAFNLAAAWTAIAWFSAGQGSDGVQEFTAGELTVKSGSKNAAAAALLSQADVMMAPYTGGGFSFMGVRA